MEEKHLIAVEKWTSILAALVAAAALLLLGRRAAFGATLGAGLMVLNAMALRRLGRRAFRTFKKPGAAVLLFNLKMFLLIALVYVVIRYLPVNPVGFVIGISIFPAAILAAAIRHALRTSGSHEESHG